MNTNLKKSMIIVGFAVVTLICSLAIVEYLEPETETTGWELHDDTWENPIMRGSDYCGGPIPRYHKISWPNTILKIDGQYHMWFTVGGYPYKRFSICHATSDNGLDWVKTETENDDYDSVLIPGEQAGVDDVAVGGTCVMYDEETETFKMWYIGYMNRTSTGASVCYATSADGINWTKYENNPVFEPVADSVDWDSINTHLVQVIKNEDGTYMLWYTGSISGAEYSAYTAIGMATSNDGITWERYEGNPVFEPFGTGYDEHRVALNGVLPYNDEYIFFYQAGIDSGEHQKRSVALATSANGTDWTRYDSDIINEDSLWISCRAYVEDDLCTLYLCWRNPHDRYEWLVGLAYNYFPSIEVLDCSISKIEVGDETTIQAVVSDMGDIENLIVGLYDENGSLIGNEANPDADGNVEFTINTQAYLPGEHNFTLKVTDEGYLYAKSSVTVNVVNTHESIGDDDTVVGEEDGDGTSTTWYFAEGCTEGTFAEWLLIQNPGSVSVNCTVTYMKLDGTTVEQNIIVGATSRYTICVNDIVPNAEVAVKIEADDGVVAERAMYWDAGGISWAGGHTSLGLTEAATAWYLAEGCTNGFYEYVLMQNPTTSDAEVKAVFMRTDGDLIERNITVKATSRFTIYVNDVVANEEVAVKILSVNGVPVVVERSMYWDAGGVSWAGGHNSCGVTETNSTWYLAEGAARGFDEYILLQNPDETTAVAKVTFMNANAQTVEQTVNLLPNSRKTIYVNDYMQDESDVSTMVETTNGTEIVAERVMYWDTAQTAWAGGHSSCAATETSTLWYLAEGCTKGFDEYILIQNPAQYSAECTVIYMKSDGQTVTQTLTIEPTSRQTIHVNSIVPDESAVAAKIESTNGVEIIVDRAMYWSAGGIDWADGHCSIGKSY